MLKIAQLSILFFSCTSLNAQNQLTVRGENQWRIGFYNVENLFDTRNDSIKRDDDFTPTGLRAWNAKRYHRKLLCIDKTIMAMGEWSPIEILALAEVENEHVLNDLLHHTPLKTKSYDVLHFESPDKRGIDVALIYLTSKVQVLESKPIPVVLSNDSTWTTRDILYCKMKLKTDTLHIWVNHWPSKYGGVLETQDKRMAASKTLKSEIDKLRIKNPNANILVLGDFNDNPEAESIALLCDSKSTGLTNISNPKKGTHKFQGQWDVLDQVLVSPQLIDTEVGLSIPEEKAKVFDASFLLMEDKTYLGDKPFRTFHGFKYLGGFSDHLPVMVDFQLN